MEVLMLSVCVIFSENDEHWLNDCIASVPPGSEICLLKTKPIQNIEQNPGILGGIKEVQKAGSTLKFAEWNYAADNFSFADARNACKTMATGEWILQLDADERLMYEADEFEHLKELPEQIGGVLCTIVSNYYPHDRKHIKREAIAVLRLFRNKPEFTYQYRAHEDLHDSISKAGCFIGDSPITIHHLGYFLEDKDIAVKKLKRNMHLMFKDLAVKPNDSHLIERLASHCITLVELGEIRLITS